MKDHEEPFQQESLRHFADELDSLIERFSREYHLPFTAVIGMMQLKATMMIMDQREDAE